MRVEYPGRGESVRVGHSEYEVGEDGIVELPDWSAVKTVARRHGLHPAVISLEHCDTVLTSGERKSHPCGRTLPCQFHSEDD